MAYAAWLIAIGVLLGYEAYALKRHKMTLSRAVWNVTARWPFFAVTTELDVIGMASCAGILPGCWRLRPWPRCATDLKPWSWPSAATD